MKILTILTTIFALVYLGASVDLPVWPNVFSQSMLVNFGVYNTTGKFLYDYNFGGQRYDYANGASQAACGDFSPQNTSCTILLRRDKDYVILPEKNLCCQSQPSDIFQPNWLQLYNFSYQGEEKLDSNEYYVFDYEGGVMKYYADQSPKTIPRRMSNPGFTLDFLINSYSQNQIDNSVFNPPLNCSKSCEQYKMNNKKVIQSQIFNTKQNQLKKQ